MRCVEDVRPNGRIVTEQSIHGLPIGITPRLAISVQPGLGVPAIGPRRPRLVAVGRIRVARHDSGRVSVAVGIHGPAVWTLLSFPSQVVVEPERIASSAHSAPITKTTVTR